MPSPRLLTHQADIIRSTFSSAFKTGALFKLDKPSVIFNIFINVALYLLFTLICFYAARPPLFLINAVTRVGESKLASRMPATLRRSLRLRRLSKEQTIAVCFCGAAKTTGLGIPLVTAMWASSDDLTRAYIQIPVLLYTIEQVSAIYATTFSFY